MQRAEDETARLYAEFLESFQGDSAPGSKAFVQQASDWQKYGSPHRIIG